MKMKCCGKKRQSDGLALAERVINLDKLYLDHDKAVCHLDRLRPALQLSGDTKEIQRLQRKVAYRWKKYKTLRDAK